MSSQSAAYEERLADWMSVIRDHCSGCPNCQTDYPCREYTRLNCRRYTEISGEFPSREPETFALCYPSDDDDLFAGDDDWVRE